MVVTVYGPAARRFGLLSAAWVSQSQFNLAQEAIAWFAPKLAPSFLKPKESHVTLA